MQRLRERLNLLSYNPRVTIINRRGRKENWWMNYYLPDGTRIQRPCCTNRSIAEKRRTMKEVALLEGQFDQFELKKLVDTGFIRRHTVEEAVRTYLEETKGGKSTQTMNTDRYILTSLLKEHLMTDIHLEDLTSQHCLDIRCKLEERLIRNHSEENHCRRIKTVTLNDYLNVLRKFLNHFVNKEYLDVSPMIRVRNLPTTDSEKARDVIIPDEHISRILQAAKNLILYSFDIHAVLLLAFNTGMRRGEILHLEHRDLVFDKELDCHTIRLRCKPDCPTTSGLGWKPKWGKERIVYLNTIALSTIQNQPRMKTYGLCQGEYLPADFVFFREIITNQCDKPCHSCQKRPSSCGKRIIRYVRCDSLDKTWNRVLLKAGLPGMYLFKDIRTTYNTKLIARCHLTNKEAGIVIGNTEEINRRHYTGILPHELVNKVVALSVDDGTGLNGSTSPKILTLI